MTERRCREIERCVVETVFFRRRFVFRVRGREIERLVVETVFFSSSFLFSDFVLRIALNLRK